MKIPLKEFEQHIDETILKRGYQYFKKGFVNEPEEIGHGEYEAIVEGTSQYTVQLSIINDVITEYVCSCPYEMGPVCKHVVAVIFHLQQNELNLNVKAKKNKDEEKKIKKKKTVAEQVDELLEKLSYDKLKYYANEVTDLYQAAILNYMVNNMGRDHYQNVCRYLRKIIKMGAREKANFVIEQLKVLYPKRKALMEELQKM